MANLNAVINSKPVEYSIQFNQSYTLNPIVTGSGSIGSGNKFTLSGGSGAPVYESNVGPVGGAGSWYFPNDAGADGAKLRSVSSTLPATWNDGDYTLGFWIRINSIPGSFYGPVGIFKLSTGTSTKSPEIKIYKDGSSNLTYTYTYDGNTVGFAPPVQVGQWHFITIRKSISEGTIKFSQDAMYQSTISDSWSSGTGTYFDIGWDGVLDVGFTVNISDFFIGPSTISDSDLYDIYLAGSVPPRVVKYWNGSSWQNSTGQKVWNGSAWVDWNAAYRTSGGTWQEF